MSTKKNPMIFLIIIHFVDLCDICDMVALFLELVRESLFIFFCLFSMAGKIFFIWDFSTLFFEDASKFLKGFKKEQGYVVYDKKPKELLISYYWLG